MKFGPVPLARAEGAILAHSLVLPDGARLRKGMALDESALARLARAGIPEVTVARLEEGDLHEDIAAQRIAAALVPNPDAVSLRLAPASTGRVNIYATTEGIAQIDAEKINALNAIHPMITVATVPQWRRMGARGMLATVKIISYAVPEKAVDQACQAGQSALALATVRRKKALLLQTTVSADDNTDKGQRAMATRCNRLGVSLGPKTQLPHETSRLADALQKAQGDYDILLILTGSATSDLYDTAPQALRQAGGSVTHYGMPVDPGNLLFWGRLGDRPVIGLPGCARSPALNGADWVLERLLCDVPVSAEDVMQMGVGGLLKESPSRPLPRERA